MGSSRHKAGDSPKKNQPRTGRAFFMHPKAAELDTAHVTGILNTSAHFLQVKTTFSMT